MVPAEGTQNIAPRGPKPPAEDIELHLPLGEEIRQVALAAVVPERRVRAAVVAFLQPRVEGLAAGKVAEIFQRDMASRLPLPVPTGPINRGEIAAMVEQTAKVHGD